VNFDSIGLERDGGIALITIRREPALNALNGEVLAELHTATAELELEDAIRVVVVTGAGEKAFVAGADIAEMRGMGPVEARAFAESAGALMAAIEQSHKPYIAAVNGFALGGGCELALACDFVYASTGARFGQPEVKLGVVPGFGGTQRLLRRVGVAKARELIFTGDMIGADEALRIGLVDAVAPPGELVARARAAAVRIMANGPLAVAEAKRMIHAGQSMALEHAIALEQRAFGELFATADQKEGMGAFLDKRPARFEGK
jgi:enoyl-CoA hydratase